LELRYSTKNSKVLQTVWKLAAAFRQEHIVRFAGVERLVRHWQHP
jgi:hypothetical protein